MVEDSGLSCSVHAGAQKQCLQEELAACARACKVMMGRPVV